MWYLICWLTWLFLFVYMLAIIYLLLYYSLYSICLLVVSSSTMFISIAFINNNYLLLITIWFWSSCLCTYHTNSSAWIVCLLVGYLYIIYIYIYILVWSIYNFNVFQCKYYMHDNYYIFILYGDEYKLFSVHTSNKITHIYICIHIALTCSSIK